MSKSFSIEIKGVSRDERRRILDLVCSAIKEEGEYRSSGASYPFEGDTSSQKYIAMDASRIFPDMSVQACIERYNNGREKILKLIRDGRVSASMSGIEYYPCEGIDLLEKDPHVLEITLKWNGQVHINRPNWRGEFVAWRSAPAEVEA